MHFLLSSYLLPRTLPKKTRKQVISLMLSVLFLLEFCDFNFQSILCSWLIARNWSSWRHSPWLVSIKGTTLQFWCLHEDVSDALTRNIVRPKYMNFVCVFPFCIYKLYRWRGSLNNFNLFEKLTYMYNFNKVLHIYAKADIKMGELFDLNPLLTFPWVSV